MARTAIRSPSIEARMEEEEEEESGSSDDSGDERDPRIRRTRNNMVFQHEDGSSVLFAFYKLSPGQEAHLTEIIRNHGGQVVEHPDYADTIICTHEELEDLKYRYDFDVNVYVEEISFIRRCLASGSYKHRPPVVKGMGGRAPRTQPLTKFTDVDVENLCVFLAKVIPYSGNGGRTGRGVYQKQWKILSTVTRVAYSKAYIFYQQAITRPEAESEQWILRHSAESWRCYYKTHQAELDPMIAALVKENPPKPDRKGQYHLNRRYRGGVWIQVDVESDSEEFEISSDNEATDDHIRDPIALAGQRRKLSALSLANSSRASDGHIAKKRRVERVSIRVSDTEAGRARPNSTRDRHFVERVINDSDIIHSDDHAVHGEFASSLGSRWRAGPDPDEAGPSGTQRTPTPNPEDFSTLFLPERISAIVPPRVRHKAKRAFPPRESSPPLRKRLATAALQFKAKSRTDQIISANNISQPSVPNFSMSSQATLVGPVSTHLLDEPQSGTVEHEGRAEQEPLHNSNQTSFVSRSRGSLSETNRSKTKQANSLQFVPSDAPYRNTRARLRSASVEPLHIEPPAEVGRAALDLVEENGEEHVYATNNTREDSYEEENIEEYLRSSFDKDPLAETSGSVSKDPMQSEIPSPASHISKDDLIVARNLSGSISIAQRESEVDDDDKLIAEMLSSRKPMHGTRARLMSSSADPFRARSNSRAHQTPISLGSRGKSRKHGRIDRRSSDKTTEEENFPLSGTRAAVVVDQVEKEIWTPLPGTRAAAEVRRLHGVLT